MSEKEKTFVYGYPIESICEFAQDCEQDECYICFACDGEDCHYFSKCWVNGKCKRLCIEHRLTRLKLKKNKKGD